MLCRAALQVRVTWGPGGPASTGIGQVCPGLTSEPALQASQPTDPPRRQAVLESGRCLLSS